MRAFSFDLAHPNRLAVFTLLTVLAVSVALSAAAQVSNNRAAFLTTRIADWEAQVAQLRTNAPDDELSAGTDARPPLTTTGTKLNGNVIFFFLSLFSRQPNSAS
jgi:hypothetical protein